MGLINIFDIMEISLDLKYINQYGTLWIVVYDICVGIALLSIAFPIEISSDDLAWSKITVMDLSDKPDLTLNNSNFDVKNEGIRKSYGAIVLDDGENKNNQIEHKENSPIPIDESVDKDGSAFVRSPEICQEFIRFNEKKSLFKIVKVSVMMVFIDIMFATIRFKVMITQQSVHHGFTMIVKNFILTVLHLFYLLRMLKIYIVNRKHRRNCVCKTDDAMTAC